LKQLVPQTSALPIISSSQIQTSLARCQNPIAEQTSFSERKSSSETQPLPRPSWASSPSSVPVASVSDCFGAEAKFWLKPDFLRVIRTVEGVDQKQLVFKYKEATFYLRF
jgi:hypothetical protein